MLTTRSELQDALRTYATLYPEEQSFVPRFLALLTHDRCFHRDHLPGHITASAWITDARGQWVLLTHHAKLKRWLQPGGHADGDENVAAVALREAREETGLKSLQIVRGGIFDVDIHAIPARNDFPEHLHYDVRFLFQASRIERPIITAESTDLAWQPVDQLAEITANNISMLRMAEKARLILN